MKKEKDVYSDGSVMVGDAFLSLALQQPLKRGMTINSIVINLKIKQYYWFFFVTLWRVRDWKKCLRLIPFSTWVERDEHCYRIYDRWKGYRSGVSVIETVTHKPIVLWKWYSLSISHLKRHQMRKIEKGDVNLSSKRRKWETQTLMSN